MSTTTIAILTHKLFFSLHACIMLKCIPLREFCVLKVLLGRVFFYTGWEGRDGWMDGIICG
jgi:hypothetical protein